MVCTSDDDSHFVEPKCVYNGTTGYNNLRTHKMVKRKIRFCIFVYAYEKKNWNSNYYPTAALRPTRFPSNSIYEL